MEFEYEYNTDDLIFYRVRSEPNELFNRGYIEEETVEIERTNVTRYRYENGDEFYYAWTDGIHYYDIVNFR